MSAEVATFLLAAKLSYTVLALLSAAGVIGNALLLFTTIRSKSLRSRCNVLIGSCALFDVLHQLGTFIQMPQIYGDDTISSLTCTIIMFLPGMGVVAGSFAILSIGIDRFLSIAMPIRYRNLNGALYLFVQYFAIVAFCAYNAFLIFFFFDEHEVICMAAALYSGQGASWWAISSFSIHVISLVTYLMTWRLIKAKSEVFDVDQLHRIFRTIALVTIFDLSGWAGTQIIVATLNSLDLPEHKRLCYFTAAGIPVNIGIAVKFLVYYYTSIDYRKAARSQLHLRNDNQISDNYAHSPAN